MNIQHYDSILPRKATSCPCRTNQKVDPPTLFYTKHKKVVTTQLRKLVSTV